LGIYDKFGMKGKFGRMIEVAVDGKKDRKRDKEQVWIRCVVSDSTGRNPVASWCRGFSKLIAAIYLSEAGLSPNITSTNHYRRGINQFLSVDNCHQSCY
jgi:hypothetical protein